MVYIVQYYRDIYFRLSVFFVLSSGLAVSVVGVNSFETAHKLVDKVVTIDETYIYRAVVRLLEFEKSVVECSGATSLALIMANVLPELIGKK